MTNKYTYTAVLAAIVAAFNAVVVPLMLLVTLNIVDYITGLIAARYRSQKINSYKSARGIFKKISGWLLILVGADLDILISYAAENIGLKIPVVYAVAALVAVWLTCNEIISVLENINDIGVKIPKFLTRLTKQVKKSVEKSADTDSAEWLYIEDGIWECSVCGAVDSEQRHKCWRCGVEMKNGDTDDTLQ